MATFGDEGCYTFNPRADQCFTCKDSSITPNREGKCVASTKPSLGIVLPENCIEVDSEGKCTECSSLIY